MSDIIGEIEAKLAELPLDDEHARQRADLLNKLGWNMRERADWQRVLALSEEAMGIAQAHAYRKGLAGAFRNAAFAHYMLSGYKCALAEALLALRMAEEDEDKPVQANALSVIALVQWSLGNYDEALKEAFRSLSIVEDTGDAWETAWAYTIIGGIYQSLGDYEQALRYHEKSHQIFAERGYLLGEARALTGIGAVHQALGDLKAALACHQKSLELFRSINNRVGESRALNDIGAIRQQQGEDDKALELHLQSLKIREEGRNQQAQTTSLLNLGRIYLKRRQTDEALAVLHNALAIADDIGARPKVYQAHELLAEFYEQTGDLAQALHHLKSFHQIKNQVFNEEESTKVKNLQIGLEVERSQKEAEIHRLKNVELKQKNDQLAKVLNELRATQAQLVHSEKMAALGDLVAALAHEINNPLSAISSSADVAIRGAGRVVEAIENSQTIEQLKSRRSLQATVSALRKNGQVIASASERIGKLIRSLKSFARLDQAEFQQFDLTESLEDTLTLLEPRYRGKVTVVRNYGDIPKLFGYPADLNQVFMNLLCNAAEAIEDQGMITITTYADDDGVCVRFSDTGRGIPAEQLPRLFNPGFTVAESRVKASMSLFTSLNIVQKHRGNIEVESEVGKGSVFTVRLRGLEPADDPP